jgi:hypothetical protein
MPRQGHGSRAVESNPIIFGASRFTQPWVLAEKGGKQVLLAAAKRNLEQNELPTIKICIFAFLTAVALLIQNAGTANASQEKVQVPVYDMMTRCKGLAESQDEKRTSAFLQCLQIEAQSLELVKPGWSEISAQERRECLVVGVALDRRSKNGSYFLLNGCVEVALAARRRADAKERLVAFTMGQITILSQECAGLQLNVREIAMAIGNLTEIYAEKHTKQLEAGELSARAQLEQASGAACDNLLIMFDETGVVVPNLAKPAAPVEDKQADSDQ